MTKNDKNENFPNLVGQEAVKSKIQFFVDVHRATGYCPPLAFFAAKGTGKTSFAEATAKLLLSGGKPKPLITVNSATLKSEKQLFTSVFTPYDGKDYSLLLDESHNLKKDVTSVLLSILNPNEANKNTFRFEERNYTFDFTKITFLFASTEIQAISPPLLDRLEIIEMQEYTPVDLCKILKNTAKVPIDNHILPDVVSTLRGNPRNALSLGKRIREYMQAAKKRAEFKTYDWLLLQKKLGLLPEGLSQTEFTILKNLFANRALDGVSLTRLSALTDLSRPALQGGFEKYLLRKGLMEIGQTGRKITGLGVEYMKKYLKES